MLRREFSAADPDLRVECAGTPREAIERLEAGTSHYDAVLLELTQMNGDGRSRRMTPQKIEGFQSVVLSPGGRVDVLNISNSGGTRRNRDSREPGKRGPGAHHHD